MTTLVAPAPKPGLPEAAQRYLEHAIGKRTPPKRSAKLRMHGEIKLGGWRPFEAVEEIVAGRRMVWQARTKLFGLPVSGFDRVVQGYGETQWKLFGLLPIASARGATSAGPPSRGWRRRAFGTPRFFWGQRSVEGGRPQPGSFPHRTVRTLDRGHPWSLAGRQRRDHFLFALGNPNGQPYGFYAFGGYVDEEKTFGGFTIPSRVRLGWHFGTGRFASEGEFFHATIDAAEFA